MEYRLLESSFGNGVLCILASLLFSEDVVERIVYADERYCLALGKPKTVIQSKMIKSHVTGICAVSIDKHNLLRNSFGQDVNQARIVVLQLGVHP